MLTRPALILDWVNALALVDNDFIATAQASKSGQSQKADPAPIPVIAILGLGVRGARDRSVLIGSRLLGLCGRCGLQGETRKRQH
jgi:hypothetical protein